MANKSPFLPVKDHKNDENLALIKKENLMVNKIIVIKKKTYMII